MHAAIMPMLLLGLVVAVVSAQSFHRTVFVMRHCVRSTYLTFYDEPYEYYDNYTSSVFPPVCHLYLPQYA